MLAVDGGRQAGRASVQQEVVWRLDAAVLGGQCASAWPGIATAFVWQPCAPIPTGQAPLVAVEHSSETKAPWDSCLLRVLSYCNRLGKQSKKVS